MTGLELLDETKSGARGGIVAGSHPRTFGPDCYATATLAFGPGGPNGARQRVDIDVATRWGATRNIVTHLAWSGARYDNDRGVSAAPAGGPRAIEGTVGYTLREYSSPTGTAPTWAVNWLETNKPEVVAMYRAASSSTSETAGQ